MAGHGIYHLTPKGGAYNNILLASINVTGFYKQAAFSTLSIFYLMLHTKRVLTCRNVTASD